MFCRCDRFRFADTLAKKSVWQWEHEGQCRPHSTHELITLKKENVKALNNYINKYWTSVFPPQQKRHAQRTTKYVELIIVADNREVKHHSRLRRYNIRAGKAKNKSTPNWNHSKAGPRGAPELGQYVTGTVVLWQRLGFNRKCCTIPRWTRQETGKKATRKEKCFLSRPGFCSFTSLC